MSSNFVDPNPTTAEIRANYVDSTQNAQGLYGRPLVLDRIFSLLVDLIDALQKCAAAQANRLNILSDWQKAYTDMMNQIHAFTANNGDGSLTFHVDRTEDLRDLYSGNTIILDPNVTEIEFDSTNNIVRVPYTNDVNFGNTPLGINVGPLADRDDYISDSGEDATKARSDMNTLNTNLTQRMQGSRQVVSDDAKALQTSVNQTNDAVQQQTDMATSILQQLSTILTSIFAA